MDSSLNSAVILFPIFPIILLIHLHTLVNALQIKKSILSKELDPRWLKFMPGWQEIPDNIQASRELYKNLFQAPIVFLIFCLFAYVLNNVSTFNVVLAWMYVALRIWHYYVRITNPKISKRRIPFQYSLIISLVLWIDLFVFLLK